MIISCGKFSSSFTVGSSFSGGASICISSVFTTISSVIVKSRQIFNACVDDQNQWQQAKIKNLPEQWMFGWNKTGSFRDNFLQRKFTFIDDDYWRQIFRFLYRRFLLFWRWFNLYLVCFHQHFLYKKEGKFLLHMWMTKGSGNKQK